MVTRVWGKADVFELVFSLSKSDHWEASVPADLEDGQYIIELYCEDDSGNMGYWTGVLYLCNADEIKVRIIADKFKIWLKSESEIKMLAEPKIWFMEDQIILKISCVEYAGGGE